MLRLVPVPYCPGCLSMLPLLCLPAPSAQLLLPSALPWVSPRPAPTALQPQPWEEGHTQPQPRNPKSEWDSGYPPYYNA
jgi:hypothetical protein